MAEWWHAFSVGGLGFTDDMVITEWDPSREWMNRLLNEVTA
ncbi:hypothetical protein HNR71_007004 [Kribbella sandramycini]|uniref:Uncharacterized protein n=1 Tax=Kribbella sandramycini TaxID=60450 RepID=A0A841SLC3_9ACTN|nr:hypothetical protein [Kribbella sandramycini]